jgi:hypothetical protein
MRLLCYLGIICYLISVHYSPVYSVGGIYMCRMVGRQRNQLIGSSFPTYFAERERAEETYEDHSPGRR